MWISFFILAFAAITTAQPYGAFGGRTFERTPLGDSIDVSSMKLLKVSYENASDKNIVSSPLGLMILLSMYNLALGDAAINSFLGGSDVKQISNSYKRLSVRFSEMNPEVLTIANWVPVAENSELEDSFISDARDYRSVFDKLNFADPEEAAAKINQWASEKTKGHITEAVAKDTLTPDMVAALLNVIYFNGHWDVPFKVEDTQEKDFHINRETVVKKPMMHLVRSTMLYSESQDLGAKLIELPYQENGFRMVVVLPNEIDGLPSVLEKVAEKGLMSDVYKLGPVFERKVEIDLPKFDIETKLDFNTILPKLGISKLFTDPANGILHGDAVKISKAFQRAFIKVNEEGATAGAFTGGFMVPMAEYYPPPPPLKFTADHPFLYVILHEDKILFAGTYTH